MTKFEKMKMYNRYWAGEDIKVWKN